MDKETMIWIASISFAKRLDFETLKYSDYMYGNEKYIDDVWEYVEECESIGRKCFYEKYKNFKLY